LYTINYYNVSGGDKMNKQTLNSLVKKKESNESKVVSVRIRMKTLKKLEKKGIDVKSTIRSVLERLSE